MRRFPRTLIVTMSLATFAVAGQASAGQARQRSAPPSSERQGGGNAGGNGGNQSARGSSGAQRRDSPAPQSSQSTRQSSRDTSSARGGNGNNNSNTSRGNDNRSTVARGNDRSNDNRSTAPRGNDSRTSGNRGNDRNNGGGLLGWLFGDDRNDRNSRNNNSRYDDRSYGTQRQAVPAPRDRYIDLNRNGRDDRYDNGRNSYSYGYDSRGYSNDRYAPSYRYSDRRVVIAPRQPRRFTSSWFSFRPQSRLSIGLTIGYPVAFPSWYDPYIVGTPGYVKPYMAYGGVTFDVEPRDADLWVDGEYIGRVSDYTSYDPPLTLVAGRHHIELSGDGARAIEFDITVVSGQVIPYQGTLPYVR